jgi:uncharacterized protein (TIGR00270 family)
MQCELCGKDTELFMAMVEGTQLRVCAGCGRFGKVLRKVQMPTAAKAQARVSSEPVQVEHVVSDYGQKIKAAREKRGMTQLDFSKLVTVKESLIHKMETGHFEPPIDIARKMEKILHITLVEMREEVGIVASEKKEKSEGMTIGDIMKMKS